MVRGMKARLVIRCAARGGESRRIRRPLSRHLGCEVLESRQLLTVGWGDGESDASA